MHFHRTICDAAMANTYEQNNEIHHVAYQHSPLWIYTGCDYAKLPSARCKDI